MVCGKNHICETFHLVFRTFREEKNAFEALAVGASMSIGLVANIAVMLIAFISVLALANGILRWFGSMVNEPDFTFEVSLIRDTRGF